MARERANGLETKMIAPGGGRTRDLWFIRPMIYQLIYESLVLISASFPLKNSPSPLAVSLILSITSSSVIIFKYILSLMMLDLNEERKLAKLKTFVI